jgi:hypothetical protein
MPNLGSGDLVSLGVGIGYADAEVGARSKRLRALQCRSSGIAKSDPDRRPFLAKGFMLEREPAFVTQRAGSTAGIEFGATAIAIAEEASGSS